MSVHYFSCHECDEISKVNDIYKPGRYKCSNCGHLLFSYRPGMIEKIVAYNLAALILFFVTNYFPFLSFHVVGLVSHANFTTSIYYLFNEGEYLMGGVILMTTIIVPLSRIILYLMLCTPLYFGYFPRYATQMLKLIEKFLPWGMLDVFLVGVLVSIVKLVKMGTVIPGTSLWAFMIMVFVLAAAQASFNPHQIWDIIGEEKRKAGKETMV